MFPAALIAIFEKVGVGFEVSRLEVGLPEVGPMLSSPSLALLNAEVIDGEIAELAFGDERNGQPGGARLRWNLIAVREAVFLELYVIEHDVKVAPGNPLEVSKPWQVGRLIDGDGHCYL